MQHAAVEFSVLCRMKSLTLVAPSGGTGAGDNDEKSSGPRGGVRGDKKGWRTRPNSHGTGRRATYASSITTVPVVDVDAHHGART